uniref:Uncharacterized protein n=1 Tax=viral metagenome TaxID=1070528 RepID=A0A6C0CI70_9ZZZZ
MALSKELVVLQFETDSHFRRLKWCPLVSLQQARALRGKFYPDSVHDVNPVLPHSHRVADLGIFPSETYIHQMRSFEGVTNSIKVIFPTAPKILERFGGEVILAGGCLARTILSLRADGLVVSHDADFFFVGCSKERILGILDEVEKMLHQELDNKGSVCRVTSLRTTTFYVNRHVARMSSNSMKYQFIHSRSYPSAEAVILGFDIPAGSVFYDGTDILMTPMAAFTYASSVIFIDPSRRSTTYEKRLLKYAGEMFFALGTIATTAERIKQAYVGNRPLGVRGLKHDLVQGIVVEIHEFGKTRMRFSEASYKRDDMFGDYGANAVNKYMIMMHNGFFALRGQVENIAWIKEGVDEEFEKLPVKYPTVLVPPVPGPDDRWQYHDPGYAQVRHVIGPLISAEEAVKVIGPIRGDLIDRTQRDMLKDYLLPKAKITLAEATERLRVHDLDYIGPNENPGRQHTSSFNPVYGDVLDYWFYRFYDVTIIGLPNESYFVLKCVLKQHGIHEKGVLKIICGHIMTGRSLDTVASLLDGATIALASKGEEYRDIPQDDEDLLA